MKISLLSLIGLITLSAMASTPVIVDADWVESQMNDPRVIILHVGSEDNYNEGHIPSALFVSTDAYILTTGMEQTDRVYDLPEVSVLRELLESKGIKKDSRIILYPGGTSHLTVTRLLFTFHYLGFKDQVSILSGGKSSWVAAGKELSTDMKLVTSSTIFLDVNKDLVATKEEVGKAIGSKITIIDCRAAAYFNGIDVNEHHSGGRKGHMPGAKNIPYMSLFEKSETGHYEFLTEDELKAIFEKQGLKKNDDIILYCHIGLQLTSIYTVSQHLGYKNVRVFDGSMHEWGPDTTKPMTLD